MTGPFVLDPFAALVGEGFAVVEVPGTIWTLVEASAHDPAADPATCTAFSLTFRGARDPVYAQQIVTLRHPALDDLAILIVPIAQDARNTTYQAIFN